MDEEKLQIRRELYRLLLDEKAGAAPSLVPRMLADPISLTPEIRWCLLYLIRGIGCLAGRNGLLGHNGLLDTLVKDFEMARCRTERLDWLWFTVIQEDSGHWLQRYETTDVHYSLDELFWLNKQLGRLWFIERERLRLEEPPLAPLVVRNRIQPLEVTEQSYSWTDLIRHSTATSDSETEVH